MRCRWGVVLLAVGAFVGSPARADVTSKAPTTQGGVVQKRGQWTISTAMFISMNPTWWAVGATATRNFGEVMGDERRWNLVLDVGANDAYTSPSLALEVKIAEPLTLALEYRGFSFFGKNGALLNFGRADAPYGDEEIDALIDTPAQTAGYGQRVVVAERLQKEVGRFMLAAQGAFALYNLAQTPGVYLDWETDKLVREVDGVFLLRAGALWMPRFSTEKWQVFVGPYWELTAAGRTQLVRQRLGGALGLRIADAVSVAITAGVDAQDPNRQGQGYLVGDLGIDFPSF